MEKLRRHTKKALIGIIGGVVTLVGVVLIPYPGPGWLVVFAGLAILATEFTFAEKLLHFLRTQYDMWTKWLRRQSWWTQTGLLTLTGAVVVATIWLLNGFGLISGWLGLNHGWLVSPLFR
ncbi:MAG TPA: TIGR02611 family protein [Dongiaceae bacterium]|nr:TIGR02611 family protein [Dongiaceae bacterium]